jgi:PhnB protein
MIEDNQMEEEFMTTQIQARPQPEVKGGVIAYLQVDGAMKAAEFYQRAFGAELVAAHPTDDKGRTMHVHLYINGGSLMLSDFYPEHGQPAVKPQGFTLTVEVDDIEAWWKRAVDAGVEILTPPQDMFWGARFGALRDPFGVNWGFNQPKKIA